MRIIEVPNMARFLLLYIKSAKIIDFHWPSRSKSTRSLRPRKDGEVGVDFLGKE